MCAATFTNLIFSKEFLENQDKFKYDLFYATCMTVATATLCTIETTSCASIVIITEVVSACGDNLSFIAFTISTEIYH